MPRSLHAGALAAAALALTTPAAAAQATVDKPPLHRPALVEPSRSSADRFLVSVVPVASRAARIAQAAPGCSIFSTSGTCGQEHAIAIILYGATTASLESAATDAYDIVVDVLGDVISDTEQLQAYIADELGIVFTVAADLEAEAIAKIASILGLGAGDAATPPPSVTTSGTITVTAVASGAQARAAAARRVDRVRVRLGAVGDAALVPISRAGSRRLAAIRARGGRVRLDSRLVYRVHQPADTRPDLRYALRSSRTLRLGG